MGVRRPVQADHQLYQRTLGQQVAAIILAGAQITQAVHRAAQRRADGTGQAQQVGVARHAGIKAAGQAGARGGKPVQIWSGDPQHDALVRVGIGIDAGLMQLQRAAQHPVAGAHTVNFIFHNIFNTAAQQQINLVKIMVVQLHFVHVSGTIAVHLIIRLDHALALGIGVKTGRHGTPPPFSSLLCFYFYVTAIFAIYQAIVVIFLRKIACYTETTKGAVTVRCQTFQSIFYASRKGANHYADECLFHR